jgi:hypothetical protein
MKIFLPLLLLAGLATGAHGQDEGDVSPKQGRIGISVKAGPSFPLVDFSDLFTTGFTGFVDVPYNLTEDLQVYLGLGFSHFTLDNAKLTNHLKELGENTTANIDAPYQLIPLVLGLNYSYRYPHLWPYFTMSLGMYFHKLETSGSLTTNGVTTPVASNTQTWSQDAFAVGIGSLIPIGNEGWAIDVNAKYNTVVDYKGRVLITTTGGSNIGSQAIRYVSLLGGLSYTFR